MIDTSAIHTRIQALEGRIATGRIDPAVQRALRQQIAYCHEELRLAEGVNSRIKQGPQ